jgi:hypothetical protein
MGLQNYNKRDYLLPSGCKDLVDVIMRENSGPAAPRYPPITVKVTLPEKVAVRFIAEITGQSLYTIATVMSRLRVGVDVNRSLDFDHAQLLLRHYGIWAERGGSGA